jgi:hypothetical protein
MVKRFFFGVVVLSAAVLGCRAEDQSTGSQGSEEQFFGQARTSNRVAIKRETKAIRETYPFLLAPKTAPESWNLGSDSITLDGKYCAKVVYSNDPSRKFDKLNTSLKSLEKNDYGWINELRRAGVDSDPILMEVEGGSYLILVSMDTGPTQLRNKQYWVPVERLESCVPGQHQ